MTEPKLKPVIPNMLQDDSLFIRHGIDGVIGYNEAVKEYKATLQAERQKRGELCRNHLETLEDALNDPDLYGAINGMAHALREHLTQPNNPK